MNCQDAKNLLVIGACGRWTVRQRADLEAHLQICPECGRLAGKTPLRPAEPAPETDIPIPDLDEIWAKIESRAFGRRRRPFFPRTPRWALAAAGLVFVFVFGYVAGRRVLFNRGLGSAPFLAGATSVPSWTEYAENVKPVLIDFLNRGDVRPPAELIALKRQLVREILLQTRLLQSLAAKTGDDGMGDLLQDLEFVLVSLANLGPGDEESARHLANLIRERKVSLRLSHLDSQTVY